MKISIISTTTFPTPPVGYGGEILIYDIACGLHKLGHEVILYAAKNPYVEYPFEVKPLRNTSPHANPYAEFEAVINYKQDLLDSDVVLDMSHHKMSGEYLYRMGLKKEVACYLIGNWWARPNPPFNIIVNSWKQLDMGIKGQTGFEGTPFERQHGYTGQIPPTSKYIHLGTNTDFYTPVFDKDDYFLWFGRFHPWKGTDTAIKLAIDTGENLIITGSVDESPDHQFYAHQYLRMIEGHDNIKYIPLPKDERHHYMKRELIQHAKAFLNPIRFHESFGLVNIESLACGTPVISMAMGALPEIINHGITGFLCDDYYQMKYYMGMIDEINPKDCRKDAEKRFSQLAVGKRYEKVLEELKNGARW